MAFGWTLVLLCPLLDLAGIISLSLFSFALLGTN